MKNTIDIRLSWNQQKEKLKIRFPTLTDEDLQYEYGEKDKMLNKLRIKLGKTREEWVKIISSLEAMSVA